MSEFVMPRNVAEPLNVFLVAQMKRLDDGLPPYTAIVAHEPELSELLRLRGIAESGTNAELIEIRAAQDTE